MGDIVPVLVINAQVQCFAVVKGKLKPARRKGHALRFRGGSSARERKIRATRWSRNFLRHFIGNATATRSTPKPGHMALSAGLGGVNV